MRVEFNFCFTFSQLLNEDLENKHVKSSVLGDKVMAVLCFSENNNAKLA